MDPKLLMVLNKTTFNSRPQKIFYWKQKNLKIKLAYLDIYDA